MSSVMAQVVSSPPMYLSTIWFLLGLTIFIGNTMTALLMWRSKVTRERAEIGVKIYALWNTIAMDIAFAIVGLTLTITSVLRLSSDVEVTTSACDFLGFCHAFFYHFSAMGILITLIEKVYCLWKPFVYYRYVRRTSKLPFLAMFSCIIYGLTIAVLPLVTKGEYSQRTIYSTCLLTWNGQTSVRLSGFLNLILIVVISGHIFILFCQKLRLAKNRQQLNVSVFRPNETTIFGLVLCSLFVISWMPYMITMLIMTYSEHARPPDKEKASLFGVSLLPLVFNPFLSYFLHGHFRKECLKYWCDFKKLLPSKIISRNTDALQTNTDHSLRLAQNNIGVTVETSQV